MAATVSGFLGFALSKVVDQFWTPVSGRECPEETNDVVHVAIDPPVQKLLKPTATTTNATTQTQRQNARRNNRRKNAKHTATTVSVELPLDLASKTRSYSDADPAELSSNASTCGASDDEDEPEVEDIGAKEMRLMLERAQEIKRLTKQSRQSRHKDSRSKTQTQPVKTKTQPRFPDVRAPIRLQNNTNGLWNWSVYSGFAVDSKVSYRGPRNMRNVFCSAAEAEQLESEELLLSLAAQVLADN